MKTATPAFGRLNDLLVVAGHKHALRRSGLDTLDALFAYGTGDALVKPGLESWRERIRITLELGPGRRVYYLKRYRDPPRSAGRAVRRSGSGAESLAGVEWTWMHRLAEIGVPCVRPVAFGEEVCFGRERRSALLTEAAPGRSLEAWMCEWGAGNRGTVRGLITPLAELVARLHHCGYFHRDLYLSHVFYAPSAAGENSLFLIDLQRVMHPAWRHDRWVVKDLAALHYSAPWHLVSRTDRLRWLKRYAGVSKLDRPAKVLAYRVIGKAARIARHDRRRRERFQQPEALPT